MILKKYDFLETEAIEVFEYRKKNYKYWDRAKLHK